jgi:hypothetical protein
MEVTQEDRAGKRRAVGGNATIDCGVADQIVVREVCSSISVASRAEAFLQLRQGLTLATSCVSSLEDSREVSVMEDDPCVGLGQERFRCHNPVLPWRTPVHVIQKQ